MKQTDINLLLPPIELFDLATGYQRSKTLFALVEFELPTLLAARPLALPSIARALKLHPRATDRFLNACVALQLLERDGETFRNTKLADTFLVKNKTTYLGDQFLRYDRASYPNWAEFTGRLREWQPKAMSDETPETEDQGGEALKAQHNLAVLVGHALARTYDFSKHQRLLDLGGGTGAMSIGICAVHKNLRATVFDLPQVADAARECITQSDSRERIEFASGDFKKDDLPHDFDVVLLANFLSVADEKENRSLLKKIHARLPANGAVILSGWILDDAHTSPLIPVLFCLEDINWQSPDVERSATTYEKWLRDAGFVDIERAMYCPPTSMIKARIKDDG
ncbi:MAG: class I SAM-dependent methyltransferase [Pyrinomonadaceae bacterium]